MDYQRRVGMTPDGVAGSKTWASLGVQSAQDRLADLEKGYTPSRETQDAKRSWEELAANRPEDYTSPYTERMEELLRQMEGRGPFAYDPSRMTRSSATPGCTSVRDRRPWRMPWGRRLA